MMFNRVVSEDSQALASQGTSLTSTSNRASMILYRVATEDGQRVLSPPNKLVPFPFDLSLHVTTPEDDDVLHGPSIETSSNSSSSIPIRDLDGQRKIKEAGVQLRNCNPPL